MSIVDCDWAFNAAHNFPMHSLKIHFSLNSILILFPYERVGVTRRLP